MKWCSLKSLFEPVPRLYLATKLANPHYKPEIAAQTTLVNFCVTEEGLEEQLLDAVVAHERPDLQLAAAALVRQLAEYTITLTSLEDNLLMRLANSQVRCCDLAHLLTQNFGLCCPTCGHGRMFQRVYVRDIRTGYCMMVSCWAISSSDYVMTAYLHMDTLMSLQSERQRLQCISIPDCTVVCASWGAVV